MDIFEQFGFGPIPKGAGWRRMERRAKERARNFVSNSGLPEDMQQERDQAAKEEAEQNKEEKLK